MDLINTIKMESEFIPISFIKYIFAKDSYGLDVSWRVTLSNEKGSLTTRYCYGIGCLPGFTETLNIWVFIPAARKMCRTGKVWKVTGEDKIYKTPENLPPPEIKWVLRSLIFQEPKRKDLYYMFTLSELEELRDELQM